MNPSKLFELFDKARQTLKFPSLNFPAIPLKLSLGTDTNYIWISNGFHKPNNILYGRFIRGYDHFREYRPKLSNDIRATLVSICEDPLKYGAIHGQQYKHCCFCNTELTSKESLFVGYGPSCAEKWGLPWGEFKDESLENL